MAILAESNLFLGVKNDQLIDRFLIYARSLLFPLIYLLLAQIRKIPLSYLMWHKDLTAQNLTPSQAICL